MKVIVKLAFNRITSKKVCSGVICAAILLMTVLFMTVVSISVNLISGYSLMLRMASGTDYHGYLRGMSFTVSGADLRDAARRSEDIAEAVISSNLAQYAVHEDVLSTSNNYIRTMETEKDLQHFYTDVIEGKFPTNDTEILVNPLYFPKISVGDTIGLYYIGYTGNTAGTAYAEFTVSGLIKSRSDVQMPAVLRYSDTLMKNYGFSRQYLNVYFKFKNNMNLTGKFDTLLNETLADYHNPEQNQSGILNPAYLHFSIREALNPSTVFLILFSVTVVFFCSFLLIYNVYSIALTQDMQMLGLLNVIGTTHRQMRKIIVIQSMILFTVTLPFGWIAGYFIGWRLLSPLLFSSLAYEGLKFEFSPWILLATSLLALFTLLWSATRPLYSLKSMTPIAAVDYSPVTDLPKRYLRKKQAIFRNVTPNVRRMAKYTISRSRKKTLITALSVSLSVILFLFITTLCDYLISYTEANLQTADYIIKLNHTYRLQGGTSETTMPYDADGGVGINEAYREAVENSVYTDQVFLIRTAMTQTTTSRAAREALNTLQSEYAFFDSFPELKKALSGQLDILVIGIPDVLFDKIKISDNAELGSGYQSGYAVYDNSKTVGFTDGSEKTFGYGYFQNDESVRLGNGDYRIICTHVISPTNSLTGWISSGIYRAVLYLPESAFCTEFGSGMIYAILVNAKEKCYDLLRTDLERIAADFSVTVDEAVQARYLAEAEESGTAVMETLSFSAGIDGRMDNLDQMKKTVLSIQTVGYSLAGMIFLIGVLNIVNTSLSSVTERKHEFAMLEAVGMTNRQMMYMLLAESLYSGGAAVLITVCGGFPLLAIITGTVMEGLATLDWLSGILMLMIGIAVSLLSGIVTYKLTKSDAVVNRIVS